MQASTKRSSKKKTVPQPAKSLAGALKKALIASKSVSGWTLRAVETRSRELYMSRLEQEASRQVHGQRAEAVIYTKGDGLIGSATVTLAPGEEKLARDRVEAAELVAFSTAMEPFPLPAPGDLPEVPIVDEKIRDKPTSLGVRECVAVALKVDAEKIFPQLFIVPITFPVTSGTPL